MSRTWKPVQRAGTAPPLAVAQGLATLIQRIKKGRPVKDDLRERLPGGAGLSFAAFNFNLLGFLLRSFFLRDLFLSHFLLGGAFGLGDRGGLVSGLASGRAQLAFVVVTVRLDGWGFATGQGSNVVTVSNHLDAVENLRTFAREVPLHELGNPCIVLTFGLGVLFIFLEGKAPCLVDSDPGDLSDRTGRRDFLLG